MGDDVERSVSPLLSLLLAAADLAVVLVLTTEGLRATEAAQTVADGRVLLNVHRQVEEVLILTAHLTSK